MSSVRKGQAPEYMAREEFARRFRELFYDPAFRAHDGAIANLEAIAWDAYHEGRKSPITEKAGPGFADPDYDLSVQWRETRDRVRAADERHRDPAARSRVLRFRRAARHDPRPK